DCGLLINDKIYDVTKFLGDHPGGSEVLLKAAGKDATTDFKNRLLSFATTTDEMMNGPKGEGTEWWNHCTEDGSNTRDDKSTSRCIVLYLCDANGGICIMYIDGSFSPKILGNASTRGRS
ncbi:hypothetical protein FRX31_002351, partial [Thalictrum thalictroides]